MRHPHEHEHGGRRHGRHGGFGEHGRDFREHLHNHIHGGHGEFDGPPFEAEAHDGMPGMPGFPPMRPGGPGFGPGFGPGPDFGFGFGGRGSGRGRGHGRGQHGPGRGRARRGNVRTAVLLLLAERPMHGYEIIQEIAERSRGWWKPSPGSVYPTLQLLADEDLVTTDQDNPTGKRLYALTDTGKAEAAKHVQTPPWEQASEDVDSADVALREALSTLMAATMQLSQAGTPDLRARAAKLLVETRRQLYLLLADAGTETDADDGSVEDAVPTDES